MDLLKLEAIVGHVDRETTKIYTHLHAKDLVEAVQDISTDSSAVCYKLATRENVPKNLSKKVRKTKKNHRKLFVFGGFLVETGGLEPSTSCV